MVQSELHPEDERRRGDENSSESSSNETPEGISEPVVGDITPLGGEVVSSPLEEERAVRRAALRARAGEELLAWIKTFASAAVYATLIVTFGFQVARVEGKSMEPTLQDQDRLIVNKAAYRFFGEPKPGDIVMLFYPRDPDKSFVKRIVAEEGDTARVQKL